MAWRPLDACCSPESSHMARGIVSHDRPFDAVPATVNSQLALLRPSREDRLAPDA